MLALVAPGQGAQTPGFLTPWLQTSAATDLLENWSTLTKLDLYRLGTTADADEIRETSNAQPLLVAAGFLSASALFGADLTDVSVFAGHSVGEITAIGLADVISREDAMSLVGTRGLEMSKAAKGSNTGMAAVLGGSRDDVLAALADLDLTAANENGAGQIVAAGSLANIERLVSNPPAGSRVRTLQVSGAFHTSVMQPAITPLRAMAASLNVRDPEGKILSNKDGAVVGTGAEIMYRIVGQIAGPVRWDLCMDTLAHLGVTGVIELAPAGTLVGLLKRATPSIETFALKSPEDLDSAREFVAAHGGR